MKGRNCHFTKYGGGEYRARVFGGSTQIQYGGGGTAVMTSVRLEMWKLPLYTSQRWATDGDTNLTITAKYQTTHKKRLFREKQSWIGLSGRFKWLVVKRGGGGLTPPSLVPILSGVTAQIEPHKRVEFSRKSLQCWDQFSLHLKSVHLIGSNMVETIIQSISDCWRTKIMKFSSGATNT